VKSVAVIIDVWCCLPVSLGLQVSDFGLSRLVSNNTPIIETRTYGESGRRAGQPEGHMQCRKQDAVCNCGGCGSSQVVHFASGVVASLCQESSHAGLVGLDATYPSAGPMSVLPCC
jgi:hypothetical protein